MHARTHTHTQTHTHTCMHARTHTHTQTQTHTHTHTHTHTYAHTHAYTITHKESSTPSIYRPEHKDDMHACSMKAFPWTANVFRKCTLIIIHLIMLFFPHMALVFHLILASQAHVLYIRQHQTIKWCIYYCFIYCINYTTKEICPLGSLKTDYR